MRGTFITIEGGEGTGKSTQAARLAERLRAAGREVVATREPGGSAGAAPIRALLVEGEPGRWDAISEALLVFAARRDHLRRAVWPALDRGVVVICDRFTDSTMAYQGYGRGLGPDLIERLRHIAIGEFHPDFTLIFDVPAEEGLRRAAARGGAETRFESFDAEFHQRVRDGFLDIAAREPARCVVVDTTRPVDVVADEVWHHVAGRLSLR
jgi:dTMP kinase